jgi:membrane protein
MAKKENNRLRFWWSLLGMTFQEWSEDRALRFSAALAYYAVFSLTPLFIIAISLAGLIFGDQAARGQIFQQVSALFGDKVAAEIQNLIQSSSDRPKSLLGTAVGVGTLLIGASGVFGQLKDALNAIWGVRAKPGAALADFVRNYLLSLGMVLAFGFLLIVSVLLTAVIQAVTHYMSNLLPIISVAAPLAELISFALMVLVFGMIYKVLPDVEIGWREVRIGAFVTALLFTIGKYLIALYLASSSVASSYGAAGALILVLVWIYYSTTIFFFGAEFTKVYARECGCGIHPSKHAVLVTGSMRTEQALEKPR